MSNNVSHLNHINGNTAMPLQAPQKQQIPDSTSVTGNAATAGTAAGSEITDNVTISNMAKLGALLQQYGINVETLPKDVLEKFEGLSSEEQKELLKDPLKLFSELGLTPNASPAASGLPLGAAAGAGLPFAPGSMGIPPTSPAAERGTPSAPDTADRVEENDTNEEALEKVNRRIQDLESEKTVRKESLEKNIGNQKAELKKQYSSEEKKNKEEIENIESGKDERIQAFKDKKVDKIKEIYGENESETGRIGELNKQIKKVGEDIKGAEKDINKAGQNITEFDAKLKQLESVPVTKTNSSQIKSQIAQVKQKINMLKSEKQKLINKKENLQQQENKLKSDKDQQIKERDALIEKTKKAAESKDPVSDEEIRQLKNQIKEPCEKKLEAVKSKLSDLDEEKFEQDEHKNLKTWGDELKEIKSGSSAYDKKIEELVPAKEKLQTAVNKDGKEQKVGQNANMLNQLMAIAAPLLGGLLFGQNRGLGGLGFGGINPLGAGFAGIGSFGSGGGLPNMGQGVDPFRMQQLINQNGQAVGMRAAEAITGAIGNNVASEWGAMFGRNPFGQPLSMANNIQNIPLPGSSFNKVA